MKKQNKSGKSFLAVLMLVLFTGLLNAQNVGDYRSTTTGLYTNLSVWQRYNGSTWLTPTSAEGYPGQNSGTGNVTIRTGHIITISSSGITTQLMGSLSIEANARLYLSGLSQTVTFAINTPAISIASGGSIFFNNKARLQLTTDAVVTLAINQGGLSGGCSNNSEIYIGNQRFAACAGAPGDIFTFAELMLKGGTLNAIPTSNSPICETGTINLNGAYEGAIGTSPTYRWSVTSPGSGTPVIYTTQNVTITNAVPGTYSASLTVSTVLSGTTYNNTETRQVTVNPLPTISSANQAFTVCDGSPATINLTGLVPNSTFTLEYSINSTPQTPIAGLTASAGGLSNFTTPNLSASNNGQTLQITGMTITNPTTNCQKSITQNLTLSVYTTGGGTWAGRTSSDWNTASNWCGGVPATTTDVIIAPNSTSVLYQPVIGASGANCRDITLNTGASLTVSGSNTLNVYGNWTNNGSFTSNSSTVYFTSSASTQTIGGSAATVFHNLSINNSFSGGGVRAAQDITVNGVLNLASANPSATVGSLEMVTNYNGYPRVDGANVYNPIVSHILTMGSNATTTGQGDVTGKIYRSSLSSNVAYTFGSQNTTYSFTVAPSTVTVIVTIGIAYGGTLPVSWGCTTAVQRSYEMIPTGGTGAKVSMNLRYLDSELNGNTKSLLTTGDFDVDGSGNPQGDEHGRSTFDDVNNIVGLSGVPIDYFIYDGITHDWYTIFNLHDFFTGHKTWNGSISNNWMTELNWTPQGIPGESEIIVIPDSSVTTYDPVLPSDKTIGGMQILAGGYVDFNGKTITVAGYNYNGWEDESGLSNYTNSTVILKNSLSDPTPMSILGIPKFNNLTIESAASVTVNLNSHLYISGTFTKSGSFDAGTFYNTIEYNGAAQTIVLPDGNGKYYNLILSGSGTKTMPTVAMNIHGSLTTSGTATVSPTHPLTIYGSLLLGSGTSFTAGSLTHNLAGNFENNGATFSTSGSTFILNGTSAQSLGGSSSSTFNNLTINNSSGITLGANQIVSGTLDLTSGLVTTGSNTMTLECAGSISNASTSSYINGKLANKYCATGSKNFPLGKGGNYRPLTLEYTALTGTSTVTAEQFESTIAGTLPANHVAHDGRYWSITESGGSAYTYTLTLNGDNYNPGVATPKILKGDGSTNSAYSATFNSPNYTSSGLTAFSNFAVGSECTPPSVDTQPSDVSVCDNSGTAGFTVVASGGTLSYQWYESTTGTGGTYNILTDGGVYSNTATASLSITNPSSLMNNYAYKVEITRLCGTKLSSEEKTLTVNSLPTITLGSDPEVCRGVATADLTYSATTQSPDQYLITYSAASIAEGFVNVSYSSLPVSPISINLPDTDGNFDGNFRVRNTSTGCESVDYPFYVEIHALPQGSFSGNSICSGETGSLIFDATAGTGPYNITYNDSTDHSVSGKYSGEAFNVYTSQTSTTVYTLVSVAGAYCTRYTGFTDATAQVTVESTGIWRGGTSSDWFEPLNWCGGVPTATTDVTISSTNFKPVINASGAVCRNITIAQGDTLSILSDGLSIKGNLVNNGVLSATASSDVTFDGSGAQEVGGEHYNYFKKLVINNSDGFSAQGGFAVQEELVLTNGKLSLNGNTLSIGSSLANGSITGGSASSYIIASEDGGAAGRIRYYVNDKNDIMYNFPLGDATNYSPFTFRLNNTTTGISNTYLDVYVSDNPVPGLNTTTYPSYLSRHWSFTPGGTYDQPNFNITATYTDADVEGAESLLYPIKYGNGNWQTCSENTNTDHYTIGSGSVDVNTNTLSWSGVTSFSLLGGGGGGNGPLPIRLISFDAGCNSSGQIDLSWVCASEVNNNFFSLERSKNLTDWDFVAQLRGAGTSNFTTRYTFTDNNAGNTLYYRLSQTDFDGKSEILKHLEVQACNQLNSDFNVSVQPNPSSGDVKIKFSTTKPSLVKIEILDMTGQKIQEVSFMSNSGLNQLSLDLSELKQGVYLVKVGDIDASCFSKVVKY